MTLSRRSFMRAVSAAITVSLVDLRKEVPRESLMLPFCDHDYGYKYDLRQPFGQGSLTYATDYWAMIRAELANRRDVGEGRLPDALGCWKQYWHPSFDWVPLDGELLTPTLRAKDYAMCPECGLRRVSLGDEYPDHTDNELTAMLSKYDYDVDDNTIRDKSCTVCHGLEFEGPDICPLLGTYHSRFLLTRIAALPNPQICLSRSMPNALLFRADGYEGITLGLDPVTL